MKLALICRPFSFHGGVETATAGLMVELLRRGHAIDLLTTAGQQEVPGVRVRRLPALTQPSLLRLLSFVLAARRAVTTARYDIVQSHERTLAQDIYRAGEGTHRGYLAAMGRHRARVNPHHLVLCALERRIYELRSARHVVAISRRDKGEVERLFRTPGESVSVVYNGVDLDRFHPDNHDRLGGATRDALGLDRDDWVVLFVGSGFERKGLDALLDGVSRIRDGRCRLVIAGKGDARPYRRQAARLAIDERIRWVGTRPDVEALYAAADVVALPARYEPFGNVHLEALASGVPVLTSEAAGGAEVITRGRNGWIVSKPAGDSIAEGLQALRAVDGTTLRVAARTAAEPFTYAAQADNFEVLYRLLKR